MLDKIISLVTFIPWILYFVEIMYYRISIIDDYEGHKENYFKHINKNLFKSLNIKELLLFCLFMIFLQYENTVVQEILFSAIYIYLLIDFFHTLASECKHLKQKFIMGEVITLIASIIIFYLFTDHLYTTYSMMFAVSLLSAFLVYAFSCIRKIFIKK